MGRKAAAERLFAVVFWLLVWEAAARAVGAEILLVSPVAVVVRFASLLRLESFWNAVLFSFWRIAAGFFLALILGVLFSALAYRFRFVRVLLSPLVKTVRTIPVASFIIVVLIWVSSRNLSICISFLIVFPIIYASLLEGLCSTGRELLEMADVFHISTGKRITKIYLSALMPFFRTSCSLGLALAWKSGIAAEVIGTPPGSMGESLYQAKIFLDTADLFAWTLAIVLVSVAFENLFLKLFDILARKLECAS